MVLMTLRLLYMLTQVIQMMAFTQIMSTPQKPPSDSESLQKFMFWKLIRNDFEVTSEVFQKIWCMVK